MAWLSQQMKTLTISMIEQLYHLICLALKKRTFHMLRDKSEHSETKLKLKREQIAITMGHKLSRETISQI